MVASVRGQHDAAVLSYTSALKAYRGIRHRYGICQALHNLGMTHAAARDWRASIQCYENATEMAKKLGVVDVLANIL